MATCNAAHLLASAQKSPLVVVQGLASGSLEYRTDWNRVSWAKQQIRSDDIIVSLCSQPAKKAKAVQRATLTVKAVVTEERAAEESVAEKAGPTKESRKSPIKVLVAGGGIGGLVFALAAKNRGIDVQVFEKDLTAIRGEGQYRGPIQIQSNALAALEAVDRDVAEEVMRCGCVTGDRINGLCDGLTGEWYVKFDTFTPAVENGLPVTRVISRMTLQEILVHAVGNGIIRNGTAVIDFEDLGDRVKVKLNTGEEVEGDLLVGADGIHSTVRTKLLGRQPATYSDYTCYTGICNFVPPDIETVGYRVFLGHRQYFVSSDVGYGRMQWYAFYNEPAGGQDSLNQRKERLRQLFGNWCDGVTDLIEATPEEDILRRDIYDRIPILQWGRGRVTLMGDAAHAMQPNMGQGGCMAIEDGYQLAQDLTHAVEEMQTKNQSLDIPNVLDQYAQERRLRVGAIHGMARMAAIMASTYRAYFGEGLGPFLSWLANFRIPHWGRVSGQLVMGMAMPVMLRWILGGNLRMLEGRAPYCRLDDKANEKLRTWLKDDDALERATEAEWFLVPVGEHMPVKGGVTPEGHELISISTTSSGDKTILGSSTGNLVNQHSVLASSPAVEGEHVLIEWKEGAFFVTDISTNAGVWHIRLNGVQSKLSPQTPLRLHPGEALRLGSGPEAPSFRLKARKAASSAAAEFEELAVSG